MDEIESLKRKVALLEAANAGHVLFLGVMLAYQPHYKAIQLGLTTALEAALGPQGSMGTLTDAQKEQVRFQVEWLQAIHGQVQPPPASPAHG